MQRGAIKEAVNGAATAAAPAFDKIANSQAAAEQDAPPAGTRHAGRSDEFAEAAPSSAISENGTANSESKFATSGLSEGQVMEIRAAIQSQQKFLGELIEHGHRWELESTELRIYFSTEKRSFAEMVEGRDSLEKIRAAAAKVLSRPVRVCAKIESTATSVADASRAAAGTKELREKFERDPMVRSMLQRFGGKLTEVKRREEVS